MTNPQDRLVSNVLDGRYEILARLARGGMATVYRAWDRRLERIVAVKVMHDGLGEEQDFASRFDREARSAAAISNPNVVAIYDQGEQQGHQYIVMEFVEGYTLRRVISDNPPMDPLKALTLIEPIASALASAHDAGVVHRDVKPENVLISNSGQVKVADFGLARTLTNQSATATQGLLMGTVSYMPPELVVDSKADPRSDIYSTGIVLYELLTGTKPFIRDTPISVAYAHVNEDIEPPSVVLARINPTLAAKRPIPDYLDALVIACTRRDPALRPRDGHALLSRVRRARRALEQGVQNDEALVAIMYPLNNRGLLATQANRSQERTAYPTNNVVGRPTSGAAKDLAIFDDSETEDTDFDIGDFDDTNFDNSQPVPAPPRPQPDKYIYRRRRALVAIVLLLISGLLIGFGSWWLTSGRYTLTPDLVGQDQQAAVASAEEAGLTVNFSSQEYSEDVAKGLVISTSPDAGDRIVRKGEIDAVISRGPERYAVPDLNGLSVEQARQQLETNHLTLGKVTESYHDTAAEGTIFEFSVAAGEMVKPDTAVDVTVSKGREPITVPNVTNINIDDARKQLTDLGLTVEESRENNKDIAANTVISQDPAATKTLYRGDSVKLKISDGPAKVRVPEGIMDMNVDDATKTLEDLGLQVQLEYPFGPRNRDTIMRVDPGVGQEVDEGTTVTIWAF